MVEFDLLSINYTLTFILLGLAVPFIIIALIAFSSSRLSEKIFIVGLIGGIIFGGGTIASGTILYTQGEKDRLLNALGQETVSRVIIQAIPDKDTTHTDADYINYTYDKNSSFDFALKNIQTQVTFKCTVSTSSDNKHYIGCQNDPQTANGSYVSPSEALDTSTVLTTTSK